MIVTDEQRLMLIGAAMTGLCANPEMKHPPKYNVESGAYETGYSASEIASLAIVHAKAAINDLMKEGGESSASTEEIQSTAA